MDKALRILQLEDNRADAELVQFELQEAGIAFASKVVMTEKDFIHELQEYCPDIILSDYDLPAYTGARALAEATKHCPDVPFILITGAVTEDRAIEILTEGARDYVLKTRLRQRLVPAIRRALEEAEAQRARKQAEAELRESYRTLERQVAEKTSELQENKQRLSLALTSSGMGIFEWDIAKDRRSFDDDAYRLLGIKRENFSGTTQEFFRVIHPDDHQAVRDTLREAVDRGVPYETEYRVIWPDGSVHHVAVRGKVQQGGDGHPLRIVGVCWDVTERKRIEEELRQSKERLQLATESAQLGIWDWNVKDNIMVWDDRMFDLYGISKEAFPKCIDAWTNGLHPDDKERAIGECNAALQGDKDFDTAFRVLHPDGTVKWIKANALVIRGKDGKAFRMIGLNQDITGRRRAEEELQRSERHYRLLQEELKRRADQLEEANKELESFSYSVSHDLRAPLRAIEGYLRMIVKRQGEKFDEETRRQFDQVRDSAETMRQLIDDLLALSKLDSQALNRKVVGVDQLIEETWGELQNLYPDRNMTLKMNHLPHGRGDNALLKQVIVNLLSNAIKFTKTRYAALIEVGGHEDEKELVYHVKDNGVGFDMRYQDKLFGIFQRLHSADEYEGTGIGLSLVQRIIRRHGGRVWAEGKVDEGATFYFTLPKKE